MEGFLRDSPGFGFFQMESFVLQKIIPLTLFPYRMGELELLTEGL